jgi:hypothetical protein
MDLRAGWMPRRASAGLERDDPVPDYVVPRSYLRRKRHDGFAVQCVSVYEMHCVAGRMVIHASVADTVRGSSLCAKDLDKGTTFCGVGRYFVVILNCYSFERCTSACC